MAHEYTKQNHLLKQLIFKSKEDFIEEYSSFDETLARDLTFTILSEFKDAVILSDIKSLNNLAKLIDYIINDVIKMSQNEDIFFKGTNLVIFACKHNKAKSLEFLFNNVTLLKTIHGTLSPYDIDEEKHNAFYYAIRLGNIKILRTLMDKWKDVKVEEIEDILCTAYEELKLKNVPLSNEVEIFVEETLVNLQFFSSPIDNIKNLRVTVWNINERIDLILENISLLNTNYLNVEVDEKFLYIAKFIAKNIHVLKRQIKSTYDRLPWEEIEFCLISFIASCIKQEEINLLYKSVLNKDRILNHLKNFACNLSDVKNNIVETANVATLRQLPKVQRDNLIANIIQNHPCFKNLYDDYKEIIDIYSLNKIKYYTDLALSVDVKQKEEQLIIVRALQTIGEYMKNTLESPKLSTKTSELLLQSLQNDTREIVADLRNSLSHSYSLSRRIKIEENTDITFFTNIQSDIKKINFVITHIFYKNKLKIIRNILNKIVKSESLCEIKESIEVFKFLDFNELTSQTNDFAKPMQLEALIDKLRQKIGDMPICEMEIFKKIEELIDSEKSKLENSKTDYLVGLSLLKALSLKVYNNNNINGNDKSIIKMLKCISIKALECLSLNIEPQKIKDIPDLLAVILISLLVRMDDNVIRNDAARLIDKIIDTVEFNMDNVKSLEELRDILKDQSFSTEHGKKLETNSKFDKQLTLKLALMEKILNKISLKKFKNSDKKNYAVLEMLLLDIMSILDDSKNRMNDNFLFLDNIFPLLSGKNLRNHLAHGNALIDILLMNPTTAIISNSTSLSKENVLETNKNIGKIVFSDTLNLKNIYNQELSTITKQNKMFIAMAEGNFEETKICIQEGADINARSMNLWTSLHFAAKGANLEIVKFLLEEKVNISDKEIDGQTALHVAAMYGSKNIFQFLLQTKKVHIDDRDFTGKTFLHLAAQNGHKDILELLYKGKANYTIKDKGGYNPLHYAVENGHLNATRTMLLNEKNVELETMGGFTLLHCAAERGHLKIIHYLLENNANIHAKNDKGGTALFSAVLNGHVDVVNALILKGSDVNGKVEGGCTPLHYAVEYNHENVVELLIKHGADVNAFDKINLNTPLLYAAKEGFGDIAEILLKNNASIDAKTLEHNTPLHLAASNGHLEIVLQLLKRKAVVNGGNMCGCTPLQLSAFSGHIEVVKCLIKNGCKINTRDAYKKTPLHFAAANGQGEVIKILLLHGADINCADVNGCTPLIFSSEGGHEDAVRILIKNRARVNARNNLGSTPLAEAIKKDFHGIVKLLIEAGADINSSNDKGISTLHLAAFYGSKSVIDILLKKNLKIDSKTSTGLTPLHLALENNHKDAAKLLIKRGCAIDVKANNNKTALCVAARKNEKEVVDILLANGADINVNNGSPIFSAISAGNKCIVKTLLDHNKIDLNVTHLDNQTLLHEAAMQGDKTIVEVLLKTRIDVDPVTLNDKFTPLLMAASKHNIDVVKLLIANKANVNAQTRGGDTSLHMAAGFDDDASDLVNLLLNNGANSNLRDIKNRLPIELAIGNGHVNIAKLLISCTDVNIQGEDGWTILHHAVERGQIKIVKYLVENGANLDIKNDDGLKPIHLAAHVGKKNVLEFLFDEKRSLVDYGTDFQNLLHYAALGGELEIVKFLIDKKFDVNAKNVNYITPLHLAAFAGSEEVVNFLLNNGANYKCVNILNQKPVDAATNKDVIKVLSETEKLFEAIKNNNTKQVDKSIKMGAVINVKNSDNVTPLHYACCKGYEELVDVLLKNKVNINVSGKEGSTPLHYAACFGHVGTVRKLLTSGAVFEVKTHKNKTPLDFAKDKDIIHLLKLIADSFRNVQIGNCRVVKDLSQIKNIDTVRAVMNACNEDNKTLIVVGIQHNFPKVDCLKLILQDDMINYMIAVEDMKKKEQFQEALFTYNIILEKRKKILGPDNPGTLDIQLDIALIIYKQQKFKEALDLFKEIYEKRREMLGIDNRDTLAVRSNIALVLHRLGKDQEALCVFKEVSKRQSDLFGSNDSDVLNTKTHMAIVLLHLNKLDEALKINYEIYKKRKESYGLSHPIVLVSQNNIAMVLNSQGKHEDALKMYQTVYEARKKVLGPTHSDTLRTLHNMVGVLLHQKKFDEGLAAYKEVYELQKSVLGPKHIDTLYTQINIGNTLYQQGKFICALKIFKETLDQGRAILGPNHPYVLDTLMRIESINHRIKLEGGEALRSLKYLNADINTAAARGEKNIIESLIINGTNVNTRDSEGRTPLHFAVSNGEIDVVLLLLKHGGDPTCSSNKGNTPLHTAASKGFKEILKVLLNYVKQINNNKLIEFVDAKTKSGGSSALHVATKNNFEDVAKILLQYGAKYNLTNSNNETPMDLCSDQNLVNLFKVISELFSDAKNGNDKIISKLQILNQDVHIATTNTRNQQGNTLLKVAMVNKHNNIARKLVELLKGF